MSKPGTAEALEVRIEKAWLLLAERARNRQPVTLFLTKAGAIAGWNGDAPPESVEIGTYDHRAMLGDFREDVFFAFNLAREAA